jgi:glycosyltransferase involved in cell wall biosynthesis
MRSFLKTVGLTRRRMREAAELPARVAANAPRVSVLITARNNGRFLREAIQSALDQTVPCEVIYSDDCSTDDSREVAREFRSNGVLILRSSRHLGVVEARNRAVRASTGTHLVHLDGDDVLTPTFVAEHLSAMTPGTPFVYGPAQAFGDGPRAHCFWDVPKTWAETDLWAGNSCNTSSMYARWAFDAAGGWQDGVGTMWDWDLALRATRYGQPAPSRAILRYRQHAASWSHEVGEFTDEVRTALQARVRARLARVSVGTVYSGRLDISFTEDWMHRIVRSLGHMQLSEKPELAVICTGCMDSQILTMITRHYEDFFSSIKIVDRRFRLEFQSEDERRLKVATMLAENYNALCRLMTGDIHWLVEDDILLPVQAGQLLRDQLVGGGWHPPSAATGLYRNRHIETDFLAGYVAGDNHAHLSRVPDAPRPVDFAGTGCLMFWASRAPRVWQPLYGGKTPAHDWEWSFQLRQMSRQLIVVPRVRCGHARTETDILW